MEYSGCGMAWAVSLMARELIYKWALKNYGKKAAPKWNFYKILINKDGKIEQTYSSITNPMSKKITNEIEKILNIK